MPGAVPGADNTGVNNRHDLFSGIAIYKHWENYNFVYRKKTAFSCLGGYDQARGMLQIKTPQAW